MNKNKRHIHYINPAIQKRLIISMVVIELILISLTIFWLYHDINYLIEDNMFRVHAQNNLTPGFFAVRLAQAAFVLLIINIIISSLAVWYWKNYIINIITPLEEIAALIQKLDFTKRPDISEPHETIQIASEWLSKEKNKFIEIRHNISMIDKQESATKKLESCRQLLEK